MFRNIFFFLIFIFLGNLSVASNCSCKPIPESKSYVGQARQKRFLGFYVHWTCDYNCVIQDKSSDGVKIIAKNTVVKADYEGRYWGQENGLEGICEGMVYTPTENIDLLRTIYSFDGETNWINPLRSESLNFKSWAKKNNCTP